MGMLLPGGRETAEDVFAEMSPGQYKRQAARILATGSHIAPRAFFWKE